MDDGISVTLVDHGSAEWHAAVRLRTAVLRAPLGLAFGPDELGREVAQLHLVAHVDGALAGVVVLVPPDAGGAWTLRQMAVAPGFRGRGIGMELLRAAERAAQARGATRMTLHARVSAAGFYARGGYAERGEPFVEVTVPHIRMDRELTPLQTTVK